MHSLSQVASHIRSSVFSDLQQAIEEHRARGGRFVPLHIGDTHRAPPVRARFEALCSDEREALYGYGATMGLADLRSAIADCLTQKKHAFAGLNGQRHVLVGAGATHGIFCAARVLLNDGDDVVMASPYWPLAHGIFQACGARTIEVPLSTRLYADPTLDAGELLRDTMTPKTRLIYLISPNNPDGKVFSEQHLAQIARLAVEKNAWIIADEVYADYVFESEHVSIASLPEMNERTITAFSFSKSHALAGARVGYVVGPEHVIAAARKVSTHSIFNVPVLMQRSALEALKSGSTWIEETRADALAARDHAVELLQGTAAKFWVAEGGAYLFLDLSEVLQGRPLRLFLQHAIAHGVLLAPGEAFGSDFTTWARVCYTAVPHSVLHEGLSNLRKAMESF